jgi:hypothetical protein
VEVEEMFDTEKRKSDNKWRELIASERENFELERQRSEIQRHEDVQSERHAHDTQVQDYKLRLSSQIQKNEDANRRWSETIAVEREKIELKKREVLELARHNDAKTSHEYELRISSRDREIQKLTTEKNAKEDELKALSTENQKSLAAAEKRMKELEASHHQIASDLESLKYAKEKEHQSAAETVVNGI